jgi:hypothetical protein
MPLPSIGIIQIPGRQRQREALEPPSTNLQHPEKHQVPSSKMAVDLIGF